jgi:dTDP-4-dehydrorhamnose reductase
MAEGVLIVGSGGRLGAALDRAWSEAGETVHVLAHADLDLADLEKVRATLEATPFDALVNCAALTQVDYCETHAEEAHRVNAEAVRVMGEVCAGRGARCVHISTDYVFAGDQQAPYKETDPAEPISVYGASKRAGELALLETSPEHLAVRVSWVFGPDRPSFIDQILQNARTKDEVAAIGDKWAVPTYTADVATALRPFLRDITEGGILHLCNGGSCSWQEYAQCALDAALEAHVDLKTRVVGALRMADLKAFIAKRPVHSVMSTEKLATLTSAPLRSWQSAVREYVQTVWAPRLS